MPSSVRSSSTTAITSFVSFSLEGFRSITKRSISSYFFGSMYLKERSSNSHLTAFIPKRCARGAYISRVSRALRADASGSTNCQVRALCKRSANLITRTRMSFAIATTILRTVSASAVGPYVNRSSLVTPSTRFATSSPKSSRNLAGVYVVSSTVS